MVRLRQDPRTVLPRLTLATAVYGFVVLTMLAMALGGAVLLNARADRLLDTSLDSAVRLRTQSAALNFAQTLNEDWLDLTELARRIPENSDDAVRGMMNGLRSDGRRKSWIGFADVDGAVQTASSALLEGADVSARPWFQNGLRGGFAGDLHEAVLLAQKLPRPAEGDTIRFIDLAQPVTDAEGDVIGVVAMHIDFAWAIAELKQQARALGIDLYLIGSDGTVIAASTEDVPERDTLKVLQAARTGAMTSGRETWPDGQEYFSSIVPKVCYESLPSFGWRIVGRLEAQAFRPSLDSLGGMALVAALGILCILTAATAFFVAVFIRPVTEIGRVAERIADGENVYPPETRNTREAAGLSVALAKLQDRRRILS